MACPNCGTAIDVFDRGTDCNRNVPFAYGTPDLQLAGYEVLQQIGRGGMGVVFLARQLSLNRKVAIKVVPRELTENPDFASRFDREAAVLAKLSHPNIVTIHERGHVDGQPYIIMEFIEGAEGSLPQDLRHLLRSGPLASHVIRRLTLELADALAYAHSQGVIHRDVKPSNVLIDRHGRVKLTDFGIAAITNPGDEQLTGDASTMGTPHYMAPEQHQDAAHVDAKADVFSLGVVLYELLTQSLPRGAFDSPSQSSTERELVWDKIIVHTLRPQPEQRWSMKEFADSLKAMQLDSVEPSAKTPPEFGAARGTAAKALPAAAETGVCPACTARSTRDEQFCRACGAALWTVCRSCATHLWAADRFCPVCGTDSQARIQFDKLVEMAKREAALAAIGGTLTERLGHAEQAGVAWARALKLVPVDVDAQHGLQESNRHLALLVGQDADAAYIEKRFGSALGQYEHLIELGAADQRVIRRAQKISTLRDNLLKEAADHLANDRITAAAELLTKARSAFPDDARIGAQLQAAMARIALAMKSVDEQLPQLIQEKRYYAARNIVRDLPQARLATPRLEQYRHVIDRRIVATEELVSRASGLFSSAEYAEAAQLATSILQEVADCHAAAEILAVARDKQRTIQTIVQRILDACQSHRWFKAIRDLDKLSLEEINAFGLGPSMEYAREGIDRADAYLKLLLWTLCAGGAVLSSGWLAMAFFQGIDASLPQSPILFDLILPANLRWLAATLPQPLLMLGLMIPLSFVFRRPPPAGLAFGLALVVIMASLLVSLAMPWLIDAVAEAKPSASEKTLQSLNAFGRWSFFVPRSLYWSVWVLTSALFMSHVFDVEKVIIGWYTILPGFLIAILILFRDDFGRDMRYLPATLMVCGAIGIYCESPSIHRAPSIFRFVVIPLAWLFSVVLEDGAKNMQAEWYVHSSWIATAVCVSCAAATVARPKRWRTFPAAIAVTCSAMLAERATRDVPSLPPMDLLAVAWLMTCGGVAVIARAELDPKLHVRDRLWRLTSWRRSVASKRSSTAPSSP
jgi:serine/threonine protein kinase